MKTIILLAATLILSTPSLAEVPCAIDPALVDAIPSVSSLRFGGIAALGTSFDIELAVSPSLNLTLVSAEETQSVNPGNTFNEETGVVSLDCVSFLSDTYWLELELERTEPTVDLSIRSVAARFNPALQGLWNIEYDNNFPDDDAVINDDGTVSIGGNPGTLVGDEGMFFFDLTFSTFAGTVIRPGGFSGTFNHLGDSGTFDATPKNTQPTLSLNDSRFQVWAQWQDLDGNLGNGLAVPLTEDSGAFYFFDPKNMDMAVRVLDQCNDFNSYWVFAAGLTDVGVTLTVTDTQTSETRTYIAPVGTPFEAITDTTAFATCP